MVALKGKPGTLGLRPSREKELRGGSSRLGDVANRGDMEKDELVSETRDGAPSTDSALDASEAAGDGSDESMPRRDM